MEYPVGTGHEHLVRGGLWVGALAVGADSAFTGVTTAAVDGFTGDAAASATEFSPEGDHMDVRSSLTNNRRYTKLSVSERDLIGNFDDLNPKRAQNNREDHHPLGIQVRQENYSWSFADYRHMVFFHYVIRCVSRRSATSTSACYNELASGPRATTRTGRRAARGSRRSRSRGSTRLSMFTERYCELTAPAGRRSRRRSPRSNCSACARAASGTQRST